MRDNREWLVLRYEPQRMAYEEVGCTFAADAGTAFRELVLKPDQVFTGRIGEYRVVTLEDSAHMAIELNLRDLSEKENPRAA